VSHHGLGIGALVVPIADGVSEQLADQLGVRAEVQEYQHKEADQVDGDHGQDGHLGKGGEVDAASRQVEINHEQVVGDESQQSEGHQCEHPRYVLGVFRPDRARQPTRYRYQVDYHIDEGHYSGDVLDVLVGEVDLGDSGVEDIEVDGRGEVTGGEGQQSQNHGDVELDVPVEAAVVGLGGIEVVVLEDVEESEQGRVDPSSTLLHQIGVGLHGIRAGPSIRHVLQVELCLWLTVDTQTEDTIFSKVHVGLLIARALHLRIESHLEVTVLQQVGLVLVRFDQGTVTVG
jgi:hypothetical protein